MRIKEIEVENGRVLLEVKNITYPNFLFEFQSCKSVEIKKEEKENILERLNEVYNILQNKDLKKYTLEQIICFDNQLLDICFPCDIGLSGKTNKGIVDLIYLRFFNRIKRNKEEFELLLKKENKTFQDENRTDDLSKL